MVPDIVAAGGVILDNVVTASGTVRRSQLGGNALYASAGAALCGQRAAVCAHVPANYPMAALALLGARGLDLAGVHQAEEVVEMEEWFFYRADGSRRDQLYASTGEASAFGMDDPSANIDAAAAFEAYLAGRIAMGLTYGDFRRQRPVSPADMPPLYWQAKGLHLAANGVAEQIAIGRAARERDMLVSWDPGPRAAELSPDDLAALLALVDAALPSETELAALRPDLSPPAALLTLKPLVRGFAAVKLGAQGVLFLAEGMDEPRLVPALPADTVDLTGAGDAFCGGALATLCGGGDALDSVRNGVACARIAVSTCGPLALLDASARMTEFT